MADWKSRWRSLVSRGRDRETVLGLNEEERSASDAAALRADEPADSADGLASDDVAATPVAAAAGAAEEPVVPAVWAAPPEPAPAEPAPAEPPPAEPVAAEPVAAETAAAETSPNLDADRAARVQPVPGEPP